MLSGYRRTPVPVQYPPQGFISTDATSAQVEQFLDRSTIRYRAFDRAVDDDVKHRSLSLRIQAAGLQQCGQVEPVRVGTCAAHWPSQIPGACIPSL